MKQKTTLAFIVGIIVISAVLVPKLYERQALEDLKECKKNLRGIGTAMEMYSTDWNGKYPDHLSKLTPNYLKIMPRCPIAESGEYGLKTGVGAPQNEPGYKDYYFLYCEGNWHKDADAPADSPSYNGLVPIPER